MEMNRRRFGNMIFGALMIVAAKPALAASTLTQFIPAGSAAFDHAAYDNLLQKYVSLDANGYASVAYGVFVSSRAGLDSYVSALAGIDPAQLSWSEAHAYWINLYNAKTLAIMLENWPVKSIRDIRLGGGGLFGKGPWSKKLMIINGQELSLDDIEHRIIRPVFNDPLSHYALNCASYSCPNLMPRAYTAANLKTQMKTSATLYINHPRGVSVENGKITASKIYSWYAQDFGGEKKLKAHWIAFANPGLASQINAATIDGYNYDWSPNVAR